MYKEHLILRMQTGSKSTAPSEESKKEKRKKEQQMDNENNEVLTQSLSTFAIKEPPAVVM